MIVPAISRTTEPEGLANEASQRVSKCETATYANGSAFSESDFIPFGRVSGNEILNDQVSR